MLLRNEDRNRVAEEESQAQSMTQLQYIDPDAQDARDRVLARLMGEGEDGIKRRKELREKAPTIGDLMGPGGGGLRKRVTRKSAGKLG